MLTFQLDLVSDTPAKPVQPKAAAVADETSENEATDAEAASPTSPASGSEDEDARQVSREEAETYAKESNLLFFEASAKVSPYSRFNTKDFGLMRSRLEPMCLKCSPRLQRRSLSRRLNLNLRQALRRATGGRERVRNRSTWVKGNKAKRVDVVREIIGRGHVELCVPE